MKRFLVIIFTIFALFPFMPSEAYAAENLYNDSPANIEKSGLYDDYDMFGDSQEEELNRLIKDEAEKLDMNIVVFVAGKNNYMSDSRTEIFADDTYDELFGEDTDGVFYFMDFTGKKPAYDYISTSGKAVLCYEKDIKSIFSSINGHLPPSNVSDYSQYSDSVYSAVEVFLNELDSRYSEKKSAHYYDKSLGKYMYYKGDEFIVSTSAPLSKRISLIPLFYAIPSGFIFFLIFYFATLHSYKFKTPQSSRTYVENNEVNFTKKNDTFMRTHTTKTKIESSSGGSHGGGHSHSGGHGGGGSHR